MSGFSAPTSLPRALPPLKSQEPQFGSTCVVLDEGVTAKIVKRARHFRVTANTLIQAAWALVLSVFSGERDVVFGTTVSGRAITQIPGK